MGDMNNMLRSPAHPSLLHLMTQADVVFALELHCMFTVLMLCSNAHSINASTTWGFDALTLCCIWSSKYIKAACAYVTNQKQAL